MFRLFSFDFFSKVMKTREDYWRLEGFAYGVFFIKPWSKDIVYGDSSYADKRINQSRWWQRIIHKQLLKEYCHYLKTGEEPERFSDKGGEWGGIRLINLRFPVQLKVQVEETFTMDHLKSVLSTEYAFGRSTYEILEVTVVSNNDFRRFKVRQ